jgi:phosphate-selective porin OprO and OprP
MNRNRYQWIKQALLVALLALVSAPRSSLAQEGTGAPREAAFQTSADQAKSPPNATLENTIDAQESSEPPQRRLAHWNEYEGPYFTGRFGAGFLVEVAGFAQDENSKRQVEVHPDQRLRDFRFILGGKLFPQWKRKLTWSMGIMYDGPNHQWLMRQTGVMIAVPELWGHFFIGRSKEGFSLNKVMVGYDGWTMERSTMNDASIPILADGIKWLGYSPKRKFLWNLGYFNDILSKGQGYSTYSSQEDARFALLPILNDSTVLHLGVNLRHGKPVDNQLRLRSRPEAFPAPYFVNTDSFQSDSTRMAGYEAYYRRSRWLFGSEYWWVNASSDTERDPVFHGGDVAVTYLFNDATRVYNTVGGYFRAPSPKRTVFDGGPGAWELVLRYSYIDLDSKAVRGGKFWRFTPLVNWHMSENVRLEMAYGYGHLDRFDLEGNTHFFQSRVQLQF